MSRAESHTESAPYGHRQVGLKIAVFLVFTTLLSHATFGQQISASISGTATDSSGSALAKADVELRNEASGDLRHAVTNGAGVFSVVSVPPGSYSVKVTATGFTPWQATGIVLSQGDSRTLTNVVLRVGNVKQQVEVVSESEAIAPVDSGAVSTTLNQEMVENFTISGRDAGEFVKILPGMGLNSGLNNNSSFNGADHVTGSNSGPAGAYSANGTVPNGGMAYMLDGASLLDSNMGTQIANINPEMVSEVKMLTSSYGAEFAQGPTVFQAISKSGGSSFHGEGYFFARSSVFSAEDSYSKSQGLAKPDSHYYYPGGNFGGPVLLPFTKFNRNRNKLFFWVGFEYMNQHPAGSLSEYFVPTDQMRTGNFSPAYLSSLPQASGWGPAYVQPCAPPTGSGKIAPGCPTLAAPIVNGVIPQADFDPNGQAYLKLYPEPNVNPATHGGYNYQFVNSNPQNRWEQAEKVDYDINDTTKVSVAFNYQKETDFHPITTWWAPSQALPYPSPVTANTPSRVLNINFTKVFSPTLVNEAVVADADYVNVTAPVNPAAINPSNLGMTYKGLFGVQEKQIADVLSWSSGLADIYPQANFGGSFQGGKFGAHKYAPSVADNLSKVLGTHTMKFGFYWAMAGNQQTTTGAEGLFEFESYGSTTTGNTIADLLTGHANSYAQTSSILAPNTRSVQYSFYAQDSWKATKRLTLNYGLRMDHIGQYYDPTGNGAIVFDQSKYDNSANAPANTGVFYHKVDSSIPLSGWVSPIFYPLPRLSAAYDLFGNGKTVLRGGASLFRFQVGTGVTATADANSNGQFTYTSPGLTSLASISSLPNLPTGAGSLNGATIFPLEMGDNRTPNTWDYNFTISQSVPWRSLVEVSYVGNRTRDLLVGSSNNKLNDLNIIAPGTYFKPDPITGAINCVQGVACNSSFNANDYFPLRNYQDIYLESHGSYSNYNSVQASWIKRTGPVIVNLNYTFGKSLGTWDGTSGNGAGSGSAVDGTALTHNYGPLAYDHTHIFNASYFINLPKPIHANAILKGAINGWQLSGWTGLQSGVPLQPNTAGGLNVLWPNNVSNSTYLGTNAINLQPVLTCDPRKNLSSGQHFNTGCFAPPAPGTNGTLVWPYIHGPGSVNSDLSIFKEFKLGEARRLQIRFEGFNFLNHPNASFNIQNNGDIKLSFANSNGSLSQMNTNIETNGKPAFTQGNRLIEMAAKFYF